MGQPMSLAQWVEMPEDEPGELVDGRLVEDESPDFVHEGIVAWLMALIHPWVFPRGGRAFASGGKFALTSVLGRMCDLSVFLPGSSYPPSSGPAHMPPDIMVEVISRRRRDVRRDRIQKANEYAAFGVRFYWLIDPKGRTVEIFELGPAKRYTHVVGAWRGIVDVPGCPGLRFDLNALWSESALPGREAASARHRARRDRPSRPMSFKEWVDLPEDDTGELVNRNLVPEEESDPVHEILVAVLNSVMRPWVVPRGGFVFGSCVKYKLGPKLGRMCDLSVFLPGGAIPPLRGAIHEPPDIMVEVVSRKRGDVRRDRIQKASEYARFGVRFYWLIEPLARTLEIFELDHAKRYTRVVGALRGVVNIPGCLGLRFDLDALWAETARLGRRKGGP